MKKLSVSSFKYFIATALFGCLQLMCWCQDNGNASSTTVKTTTTEHTEWYTAPWVWVVGGAVIILLLVALLSGRNSTSRTTVTNAGGGRTITTETDEV